MADMKKQYDTKIQFYIAQEEYYANENDIRFQKIYNMKVRNKLEDIGRMAGALNERRCR